MTNFSTASWTLTSVGGTLDLSEGGPSGGAHKVSCLLFHILSPRVYLVEKGSENDL